MTASSMMRNTCVIAAKTASQSTASGAPTYSWANQSPAVACSVQQSSGFESNAQYRETGKRQFNIYFPAGTVVTTGDRLNTITGAGVSSALIIDVTSPPQDHAGRSAYLMVTGEEYKA